MIRARNKNILRFFAITVCAVVLFVLSGIIHQTAQDLSIKESAKSTEQQSAAPIIATITKDTSSISIGWVGDIAPARIENEYAVSELFDNVREYLSSPDIMLGNLEGTLSTNGTSKCDITLITCYSFSGSTALLETINRAGFDGLNIANNHAYDYGRNAYLETKDAITVTGIMPIGQKNDIQYSTVHNKKIAFVGASSYYWSPSLINVSELLGLIREADKNADIIIVLFHGGGEGREYAHTTNETEWYMEENRGDLRMVARRTIDEGADAVLGSGPHVLRGIEFYKERIIAYSLGNFAFSGGRTISQRDILGTSAILNFSVDEEGSFKEGSLVPIQITVDGVPMYDESQSAITFMGDLSQQDFPMSGANIDPDGSIHIPAN